MKIIPELNQWLHIYTLNSRVNDSKMPMPVEPSTKWNFDDSVLSLLFDENFNSPSYNIYYKPIYYAGLCIDPPMQRRLSTLFNSNLEIMVNDSTDVPASIFLDIDPQNVFEFDNEEMYMLDDVLSYRNDTTDSTSDIQVISYQDLNSSLSKMLYMYLKLVIDKDISLYNINQSMANPNRLIEILYEKYLIDNYFEYMSNGYQALDSSTGLEAILLQPVMQEIVITADMISNKYLVLENISYDIHAVYIKFYGVYFYDNKHFNTKNENGRTIIDWNSGTLGNYIKAGKTIQIYYPMELM